MPKSKSYTIGYGRPPVSTRFKKGQPGKRGGAPNGRNQGFAVLIDRMLARKIQFTADGERKQVTMSEVIVRQLVVGAAQGDMGDLDLILKLKSHAQRRGEWPAIVIEYEGRDF